MSGDGQNTVKTFETEYEDMRRLAMFLLARLGGDVTITEAEKVDLDFRGLAIEVSEDPATFSTRVRLGADRSTLPGEGQS
jgi:hypothetical protein